MHTTSLTKVMPNEKLPGEDITTLAEEV